MLQVENPNAVCSKQNIVINSSTDYINANNTGDVVDRNELVGDIYVKPNRAINYIQLNFVAVRSGVEFSEIIG